MWHPSANEGPDGLNLATEVDGARLDHVVAEKWRKTSNNFMIDNLTTTLVSTTTNVANLPMPIIVEQSTLFLKC